jgi:hypothetical protein
MSDADMLDVDITDEDITDEDITDEDANSPSNITSNSQDQQYLVDTIAHLEHRLQKALTSIDSYQIERDGLIAKILELKIRLQNVVDILNK